MSTVIGVYTIAPHERTAEDFLTRDKKGPYKKETGGGSRRWGAQVTTTDEKTPSLVLDHNRHLPCNGISVESGSCFS